MQKKNGKIIFFIGREGSLFPLVVIQQQSTFYSSAEMLIIDLVLDTRLHQSA